MSQVTRKGEKPVASPALEEALRRRRAEARAPTERDAPPVSTFPGRKPHIHEGQLTVDHLTSRTATTQADTKRPNRERAT